MDKPCKPWEGRRDRDGYGLTVDSHRAHRVAWEAAYGPIPDGLYVLHACDNPPCVEVAHLWLGTQADNLADMRRKGRAVIHLNPQNLRPSPKGPRGPFFRCGHSTAEENTYRQNGRRKGCRTCCNARRKANYRKGVA